MIAQAKRPLIYAGGGIILSEASAVLSRFAEKISIHRRAIKFTFESLLLSNIYKLDINTYGKVV